MLIATEKQTEAIRRDAQKFTGSPDRSMKLTLETSKGSDTVQRIIGYMQRMPLAEIAALPDIQEAFKHLSEQHLHGLSEPFQFPHQDFGGLQPLGPEEPRHNLASICERYGGGHARVGAISLEPGQVDQARQVAAEIATELRS